MNGIEALRVMRRSGRAPQSVSIATDRDDWDYASDWHLLIPNYAQLFIAPSENVHRQDLRCLIGLLVWVCGDNDKRIDEVVAACKKAGASRVFGVTSVPVPGERFDTTRITDTKGSLTWPA